jgi:tape measure domain-containing protein
MAATLDILVSVKGDGTAEIKKVANAAKEAEGSTKNLKQSTDQLSSSFSSLRGVIAAVGLGALIKEGIQMADTYKMMNARLTLAVASTKELATAQTELYKMAQNSRSSLEATTALYTKLEMATDSMGKSQAEVLRVTEAVGKALKISGAGAAESASAMMQLGQALGSGVLRGDELNSIMENAPRLAKSIADGLGVTIGQLRSMGAEGQLTAEKVFTAIEKSGAKLDSEFKKIPPTVSDGMTKIENSLMKVIGEMDKAHGVTESLAKAMIDFSKALDNNNGELDTMIRYTKDAIFFAGTLYGSVLAIDGLIAVKKALEGITVAQWAFNTASKANPYIILAMAGISVATIMYDQLQDAQNKFDQATKKQEDAHKKQVAFIGTAEGRAQSLGQSYKSLEQALGSMQKQRLNATGKQAENLDKSIKSIEAQMRKVQNEAKGLYAKYDDTPSAPKAQASPSSKELDKLAKAREKAEKDRLKALEDEAKIQRGYLESYAALQAEAALHAYNTQLGYEESYRDIQAANAIEQYNQDVAHQQAWADIEAQAAIKKFEDETRFWDDLFVNISKAMDDQFFNAMSGKFKSFGSWLKDFWGSITESMTRGLSKSLADTIMGTGTSGGGLQNVFKSFGGLGGIFGASATPSALIGSSYDPVSQMTTTVGGSVLDSAGQLVTAGSDSSSVLSMLNSASTLKSAYGALTGGLAASVTQGFGYLGMGAQSLSSVLGASSATSGAIGGGIANFGAGVASPWAGFGSGGAAGWGSMAGGAAIGGVGGYALGSIGDKLLGADTKAANYGAIGGATGAIVGSIVPVIGTAIGAVVGAAIGSLIGGAFGKTKVSSTDSGVQFWEEANAQNVNGSSYVDMLKKKKSWFSSSETRWTEYSSISSKDQEAIRKTFETYDFLLAQMGKSGEVAIAAGKYSGSSFQEAITKSFITKITGIEQTMVSTIQQWSFRGLQLSIPTMATNPEFTKIYTMWSDYATSINKSILEAFSDSIGSYIGTTRSFTEWKLGSGSLEQLQFTADYLSKDFAMLSESMGVSGVTVENYLSKYDEALKASFTPETISSWKNLGDALMSATDANSKYVESLKNVQNQVLPRDMMLNKTNDGSVVFQKIVDDNTTMKLMYADMLRTMKSILTIQQFGVVVA